MSTQLKKKKVSKGRFLSLTEARFLVCLSPYEFDELAVSSFYCLYARKLL